MKIHIAICDDEQAELAYLGKIVSDWARTEKHAITISEFDSAEAFLFAFEDDKSFDILFLDIQMKNIDGIALAKHLRDEGMDMQIVFITGFSDYISEGYEVSALHYLIKPVNDKKLWEVLNKAYEKTNQSENYLLIETATGPFRFLHKDIMYAEAFSHSVMIQTAKGVYEAKISISALQDELSSEFVRCHRSYLVGLRYVERITKNNIIMDNGMIIPLSRRLYQAVNVSFIVPYGHTTPIFSKKIKRPYEISRKL